MNVIELAVGQELPGLSIEWLEADRTVAQLATGWTGSVKLAHSDRPLTVLHTVNGVTLANTSPNFVLASWGAAAQSLVTAWGRTPSTRGTLFYAYPHLVRNADSADRPWPGDPIHLFVTPALT